MAACLGVQRLLRQLNPDRPLSEEDVEIARYRAGRPDYPLGMAIDAGDNGRCLEEMASCAAYVLRPSQAKVSGCRLFWLGVQA